MYTSPTPSILICLGSSCFARGNSQNLGTIKEYLTENGIETQVDFRGHLCQELCTKGPVIKIGDTEYTGVNSGNILSILSNHF